MTAVDRRAQVGTAPLDPRIAGWSGLAVAAVGAVVLAGWAADIETVQQVVPGAPTMKANTAIGLALVGVALAARAFSWPRAVVIATTASAAALGLATIASYALDRVWGLDQLLFDDPATPLADHPGRPSLATVVLLVVTAAAIASAAARLAHALGLVVLATSVLVLLVYLYGRWDLPALAPFSTMAVHTAACFAVLGTGIVATTIGSGPAGAFVGPGIGAAVTRRLFVLVAATMLVLGLARGLLLVNTTWYTGRVDAAAVSASTLFVLVAVFAQTGRWLSALDAERADAEVALRALNLDLEDQVRRRTAALDRRRAELERANAELEEFGFAIAHDIQAPLRTITTYLDMVSSETEAVVDPRTTEVLQSAFDLVDRVHVLVTDLLAYARAGGAAELGAVDSGEAWAFATDDLASEIASTGAVVTADAELPTVWSNVALLSQVFVNALSNGLKFRGDGPPRVHLSADENAGWWQFTVRDHGIGFDERFAARMFEPLRRLHTRDEYPGSGIGLSICRKIVERHGGQISATSEPEGGASLRFTVPGVEEGSGRELLELPE